MFTYCFDDETELYCVFGPIGAIVAMFETEYEAVEYCARHNRKVRK